MILYFNTKIISRTIHEFNKNSFYPVIAPKDEVVNNKYKFNFKILKEPLKSYSKLNFEYAIFNIELEEKKDELELEEVISSFFSMTKKELRFERPSTQKGWVNDIKRLSKFKKKPIFTVFNHDHIFLDHQLNTFKKIVKDVFQGDPTDFKKVFYYSHAPEIMSMIFSKETPYLINKVKDNKHLYSFKYLNFSIDSFAIMTYETLAYIFNSIIKHPKYIGRMDWPGLYFKKLKIEAIVYPREFFSHYEGYGHVTGTKLYKNIHKVESLKKLSPQEILDFYYIKWLNISFLFLRDSLRNKSKNLREKYQKSIETSIETFLATYVEEDFHNKAIEKATFEMVVFNLRSKIYKNANEIFLQISVDNQLGFSKSNQIKKAFKDKLKNTIAYPFYIKYLK